ncbi:3'-5' exonuclease [Rhodoferax sp. PAMC 29310]|uniref:3'-5' exonuclease n=1 Tax=Rhodoferax sp. PAMC 29310 TaxID=2822760 RepID=UPI001B32E8A3
MSEYHDDEKWICYHCVGEEFLANEIDQTGQVAYCGNQAAQAWTLETLPDRVGPIFEKNYMLSVSEPDGYEWALIKDPESDYEWTREGYGPQDALERKRLPHQVRRKSGSFNPAADWIKVLTMHLSKGLEFPNVALPGIGQLPTEGEDEQTEAQLFYVASTRATSQLILTSSADSKFSLRLSQN